MPNDFTHIRPARITDAARLAEIEIFNYRLNFYPIFRYDPFYFEELSVPAMTEEYRREPERILHTAVYDDGVVKGFIRVNGGEIEKLFVEPVLQNCGIGGALFRYAVETLGGRRLYVLEKNPRAIHFYERHGFHLTEHRKRVDDTSEFLIRMER